MKFKTQSDEYVTRVALEGGGKLYFNLRDYRRYAHRETPLLCVFYEGPTTEREMDYFEMSIYMLDGSAMVGDAPIGSDHIPRINFLNLSQEKNERLKPALAAGFVEFVERNYAKLEELATTTHREVA
jgi:hypothetical protein